MDFQVPSCRFTFLHTQVFALAECKAQVLRLGIDLREVYFRYRRLMESSDGPE